MAAVDPTVYQGVVSSRLPNALKNAPQISASIFSGLLKKQDGPAVATLEPINSTTNPTKNPAIRNKVLMGSNYKFGIGYYRNKYPGYRKVTEVEWRNPAFQAQLVAAHQEGGGWALLEEPLECKGGLCVAEGFVRIDGAFVAEVGYNHSQQLRGVYPAMNFRTKVAWTTAPPTQGKNWNVMWHDGNNYPCLFVHESYNPVPAPAGSAAAAAAPGGGSRRSRRHKRRNYIKKQKKRTRKH